MVITRRNNEPIVDGHLLENVKYGQVYKVVKYSYYNGYLIHDDEGQEIWISKGIMKYFFNTTGRIE